MGRRRLDRLPGMHPILKQSRAAATEDLPPYVPMRRLAAILAGLGLVAVLVVGLTQAGGDDPGASDRFRFELAQARRDLAGAPAALASLHAQSAKLLPGGRSAFRRRLAELKGYDVVVNKWASWCTPCRTEFPFLQSLATSKGKKIAFIGVNSGDSLDPARRFLRAMPLPFPSYLDPDEDIAKSIRAPANYPVQVFFDRRGRLSYVHQGAYRRESDLAADMQRYLAR